MLYSKEDIVRVSQARGGWQGIIIQVTTIGSRWAYLVQPLEIYEDVDLVPERARLAVKVLEDEIVSANQNYPVFEVGDHVNMFGLVGTILSINGDLYQVETITPRHHYTQIRSHFVYRWQLLLFNAHLYQTPA